MQTSLQYRVSRRIPIRYWGLFSDRSGPDHAYEYAQRASAVRQKTLRGAPFPSPDPRCFCPEFLPGSVQDRQLSEISAESL